MHNKKTSVNYLHTSLTVKLFDLIQLLIQISVFNKTFGINTNNVTRHAVPEIPAAKSRVRPAKLPTNVVRLPRPITQSSRSHIKRYPRVLVIPARQCLLGSLSCNGISRTAHGAGCCLGAVLLGSGIVIVDILTEAVRNDRNRLGVGAAA